MMTITMSRLSRAVNDAATALIVAGGNSTLVNQQLGELAKCLSLTTAENLAMHAARSEWRAADSSADKQAALIRYEAATERRDAALAAVKWMAEVAAAQAAAVADKGKRDAAWREVAELLRNSCTTERAAAAAAATLKAAYDDTKFVGDLSRQDGGDVDAANLAAAQGIADATKVAADHAAGQYAAAWSAFKERYLMDNEEHQP